ncbi:NUDIX hydrolase [Metaplanococcus flavidus]|uniref:NUDIX hydrolase n=1 Tax=Metaplanococcus flavidus TaxID=569883 RepID=A0ABW3LD23_9BACL
MTPRANTLGIIYRDNHILLEENRAKHSTGTGLYYRPIGGTIELGEKSSETLQREFYEELAADIEVRRYITCLENIYEIEGKIGHEITQIYEVGFKDSALYQRDSFQVVEGDRITYAKWMDLNDLFDGKKVLYPAGLIDFL